MRKPGSGIRKMVGGKARFTTKRGPNIPPKEKVPTAKDAKILSGLVNPKSSSQRRGIAKDWFGRFNRARSAERRKFLWKKLNYAVADSWGVAHKAGIKDTKNFTKSMILKKQ